MGAWPIKRMEELCEVTSSKRIYAKELVPSGVPFLKSKEIIDKVNGQTIHSNPLFISEERFQQIIAQTGALEKGDVLLTSRGTLGVPYVVRATDRFHFADGNLTWFRKFNQLDSRYLSYFFLSSLGRAELSKCVIGSSQLAYTIAALKRIEIALPPLPIQRRIAGVLSVYDSLIGNNLRRTKILEEMAQNHYREWFVKFRFPGHEQIRMIDSPLGEIPEGWEVATLEQYLSELESGKRPKGGVGNLTNGIPSVGAENVIGIGVHNYQSEKFVSHEFFEGMKKGVAKDGDVALYKDGAYIGRSTYFRDGFPHGEFCVNEHVFLLRSTGQRLTQNLLYLWMKENSTISAIRATNANAAQPGINQKGVKGLQLVIPTEQIALQFNELIDPYLALIVSLAKRNNILRQTRDLLLSKLISGELDVSELGIETSQKVA